MSAFPVFAKLFFTTLPIVFLRCKDNARLLSKSSEFLLASAKKPGSDPLSSHLISSHLMQKVELLKQGHSNVNNYSSVRTTFDRETLHQQRLTWSHLA